MLVKVRNDDPSRLSATEQTVVNWLKSWHGAHSLPGIAVFKARGTDAVVWTPDACVVVSVKGFTERVTGALTVTADQPWTLGDRIAPLEGQTDGTEAMVQIRERTAEIEELLRAAPGREHVTVLGIVLIIPLLGTRITLDKGPLPDNIDVVVGDGPSSLRTYFTRIGSEDEDGIGPLAGHWDASQVSQGLGALGYAAAATYSELTAEGFPAPDPNRTPPPPRPRPKRAVPVATAPAAEDEPDTEPVDAAPRPAAAPVPEFAGAAPEFADAPQFAAPPQGAAPQFPAQPGAAPPRRPADTGTPQPAMAPPVPPAPGAAPIPAAPGPAGPPRAPETAQPGPRREFAAAGARPAGPAYRSPAQPYAVPFDPRPEPQPARAKPPRTRARGLAPMVLLACAIVILAVAALCTGGSTSHKSTTTPSSVFGTSIPATRAHSTTTDPTIPSETAGKVCYPLQPC